MTPELWIASAVLVGTLPLFGVLLFLVGQIMDLNEGFAQFNKLFTGENLFAPVDTAEGEKLKEFKATPPTALYETDRARALSEGLDLEGK